MAILTLVLIPCIEMQSLVCSLGATADGSYAGLNTGMRRSLPSPATDASDCVITSIYDEIHDYLEIEQ